MGRELHRRLPSANPSLLGGLAENLKCSIINCAKPDELFIINSTDNAQADENLRKGMCPKGHNLQCRSNLDRRAWRRIQPRCNVCNNISEDHYVGRDTFECRRCWAACGTCHGSGQVAGQLYGTNACPDCNGNGADMKRPYLAYHVCEPCFARMGCRAGGRNIVKCGLPNWSQQLPGGETARFNELRSAKPEEVQNLQKGMCLQGHKLKKTLNPIQPRQWIAICKVCNNISKKHYVGRFMFRCSKGCCGKCNGSGRVDGAYFGTNACPDCNGKGVNEKQPYEVCGPCLEKM